MKILFYNHAGKVSGAEHLLLMILARLDRDSFEPIVICPGTDSFGRLVSDLGIPVEPVPGLEARFTWRTDYLFGYLRSFFQVMSEVRRKVIDLQPGLLHANSIRSGLAATAPTA